MGDRRSVATRRVRPTVLRTALVAAAVLAAACESTPSSTSPSSTSSPSVATWGVATTTPPEYAAGLRTSLEEVVESTGVPAAIVLVRSSEFGDATFAFGNTELGGTQPVATSDHVRVGSVTKTMTATIILQLFEEGLLALDDPVSKYVSGVPDGDDVTIAELLDMRSGLYNYTDDPQWAQAVDAESQRVWQPQELLDIAFAHPSDFAPGTNWHYTNTNYILLGMIMEELTGQTTSDLFEERLFAPLGMDDTTLPTLEESSMPVPFVHGYHYGNFSEALPAEQQAAARAGTLVPEDVSEINPSWGWTAGSVISTPDDLIVWVDALVSGELLEPATQQLRMESIRGVGPDYPEAEGVYGYGYGIDRIGSYIGHGGQITGYNTAMSRDTDTDTTVIVVANLTLAPDGTPVAPTLSNIVVTALADNTTTASTLE